ncbi:MAG: glycine zipper domain-containing protein [Gemmatimonadales bacterium]
MTIWNGRTVVAAVGVVVGIACSPGDQANLAADSSARNLTLAPAESTAQLRDVPAAKAPPPAAVPPASRPAAERPRAPAAPTSYTLAAGTRLDAAVVDSINSRRNKAGDPFTARVVEDVKNAAGRVVIPAGSIVHGTITEVKPAPNPSQTGTLTLAVSSVTVRGATYLVEASIDSLETVHKGRGVEGADAARVGAGAAAGAILGRVIGGNKKGTIIGGVVGAATGAAVSSAVKDVDIILPAGAHLNLTLGKPLTVKAG